MVSSSPMIHRILVFVGMKSWMDLRILELVSTILSRKNLGDCITDNDKQKMIGAGPGSTLHRLEISSRHRTNSS